MADNTANPLVKQLPENHLGHDYIVGDIHGCYDELMALMEFVRFDKKHDRIFCTGDLIHRGPKPLDCLDLLGEKWFYTTLGNHDDYFNQKQFEKEEDYIDLYDYKEKLTCLPYIYHVKHRHLNDFYIIHAEFNYEQLFYPQKVDVKPEEKLSLILNNDYTKEIKKIIGSGFRMDETSRKKMIWERTIYKGFIDKNKDKIIKGDFSFLNEQKVKRGEIIMFCGHTVVPFPMHVGQQIYMDTGACYGYLDYKRLKYYSMWGSRFFSLSMMDVNNGTVYSCVTNEKTIPDENGDYFRRGDILTMGQSVYPSILK